jgi:hypothetical protein
MIRMVELLVHFLTPFWIFGLDYYWGCPTEKEHAEMMHFLKLGK